MGIVRFALRFPHTYYVVATLILFLGAVASWKMPTDIFPEINIPVVTVIWQYTGLSTPEIDQRVSTYSQYAISTSVKRHQEHRSAIVGRDLGTEAFLPAGRQSRPRHSADRVCNQLRPRGDAAGNPGPDSGAIQRVQCPGASDKLEFRYAQRAAALRLRHLSDPPATGRPRSLKITRQGADPARRSECRQYSESDASLRHRKDRRQAICGSDQ